MMWYARSRRASFSSTAYTTPYTAIAAPHHTRISVPANPRINAYTADLVVNAVRNTAPVAVASGYASGSHAPSGGTAAFRRKAIRISANVALPAYGDMSPKVRRPVWDQ